MTYFVKELFHTLQGEGAHTGRSAIFCRFTGCNLWSGRERDRDKAICGFCDTDFRGTDGTNGGRYPSAEALSERVWMLWRTATEPSRVSPAGQPSEAEHPFIVCTGGEPLLQLDPPLIEALHRRGFAIAIETNGTRPVPPGIDWICVSPKAGAPLTQRRGDELKLVYPQPGAPPEDYAALDFKHFFLQPMDGPNLASHTRRAIAYCKSHPRWRLGIQTHKLLGIA